MMTVRAWRGVLAAMSACLPGSAGAQVVEAAAFGLASSNAEVDRTREARGFGLGAGVGVELGRWRVDVQGLTASLRADFAIQPDYAVNELAVLATYRWRPALALQLGAARRFTSPDFAAQDVGVIRVGLLTQSHLSRLARVRASAAYLPITRFSGGGGSGLALELGFGLSLGPGDGRVTGLLEYSYQRIDREVNGNAVPIRYSVARVGVATRWSVR
jgi:hypothetical protein